MKKISLDDNWTFRRGYVDSLGMLDNDPGEIVNLPHDGMIGTKVSPDAPAKSDSGYFVGNLTNYTRYVMIPEEWEQDCVGLSFDGAMMNVTVEVNGSKVASQHYGYAPFYVDLTDYVTFGEENRITINCNTTMAVNSRWYTGSGLYRSVQLCHGPRVHIPENGVYLYTREIADGYAFLEGEVEVKNATLETRLAEVTLTFYREGSEQIAGKISRVIQVKAGKSETAYLALSLKDPVLWDAEDPNLYTVKAAVKSLGIYRTRFIPEESSCVDESTILFGIRTITTDAVRGLRINGKTVKLKGGCVHHDNGLLGSVSLYETEARKVKKLKEIGFNAIRTAHNPPSAALVKACDKLGMYIFDEAFDAWNIAKRGGDYSQFFLADWEKDLTAFIKRDRNHPSVIIWSTGNEIPERGGLGDGYAIATLLAKTIHDLDPSRPVSNGICSMWSGLDDSLRRKQDARQNAADNAEAIHWDEVTEPFTNGMDVVGYNYMEDRYEQDHERFPDRVILGSENFPQEIGFRWPLVEKLPYVIGDFTWTCWDYLGEAGIGKAVYVDPEDHLIKTHGWGLMPPEASPYPWRLANDADVDITGHILPQGAYRSVVFGSDKTHLFTLHPDAFGKVQVLTMWGFPGVVKSWNYEGYEGKKLTVTVFSKAEEVELFVNGTSAGKKKVSFERPMPCSVCFETSYEPGCIEAVSYVGGKEVSRDKILTTGKETSIRLAPEKTILKADGHDVSYVGIEIVDENGNVLPDAALPLTAEIEGNATLAGFGSAGPITEDDYTDAETISYRGRAMLILRSGYDAGISKITIKSPNIPSSSLEINIK